MNQQSKYERASGAEQASSPITPIPLGAAILMDTISDHLEAVLNLIYLLEQEPGTSETFRSNCSLLGEQLSHITCAAHDCLQGSCYCPGTLMTHS